MTQRDGLAILSAHVTPYRLSLHRRIAEELPLELHSVFLGSGTDLKWDMDIPDEIGPWFVEGEEGAWSRNWGRAWARSSRILKRLKEQGVRALVVNGYDRPTLLFMILRGRGWGMKVFLRADVNIKFERRLSWPLRLLKRFLVGGIVRRCDGVMPMGTFGRQWFAQYGAREEAMFNVPYEPDVKAIQAVPAAAPATLATELGLRAGRRHFCYLGRLVPFKRVDLLLTAFAEMADESPDWDLLVVGPGPEAARLEDSVPEALRSRIHWVGFLDGDKARALLALADCLVLPSRAEAWGVVIEEAVAAGLVVVASDTVGAAKEIVEDGVTGTIFEAESREALSAALREVSDPEVYRRYRVAVPLRHAEWKRHADPVLGLKKALEEVGVLSREGSVASA